MLRLILLLRVYLPQGVGKALLRFYWQCYWWVEEEKERHGVGVPHDLPIAGSERAVLFEQIVNVYPFSSVLEVGCSFGHNLSDLGGFFPEAVFHGIDANAEAISCGREILERQKRRNVELEVLEAQQLQRFQDSSFDIVICSGFLLAIAPEQIQGILRDMFRVCRQKIFILEQHDPSAPRGRFETHNSSLEGGYWIYNYELLLDQAMPLGKRSFQKILSPRWVTERWGEYACLIVVEKNQSGVE